MRVDAAARAAVCRLLICAVVLCAGATAPRHALRAADRDASEWHETGPTRIRLIWGGRVDYLGRAVPAAGVEIVMEPGWKTTWRNSDGAVPPPAFDWHGSDNLEQADVLWPVPARLAMADGKQAAGYQERVVFPVLIVPEREGEGLRLGLEIHYGVCRETCIPVEARLALDISGLEEGAHRDAVRAALELVPRVQAQGVYCPHSFITGARRRIGGKPALVIKTAFDERVTKRDLFAEVEDGFIVPAPVEQPNIARGRSHFILKFADERQAAAMRGQTLRLTLASELGSCETTWRVK